MPIYEFECPVHGKFERILPHNPGVKYESTACPGALGKPCQLVSKQVEFSVPAKRNPEYGVQK